MTKGVASVRSPVRNLHDFGTKATHDDFVDAVVESFQLEYGLADDVSDKFQFRLAGRKHFNQVQVVAVENETQMLEEGILDLKVNN